MNFMFTWHGIPCVYYGTEKRFKAGAYADIHNAAAINESLDLTGCAYYGNEFADAPNHIIYQHIKKLNAIRKAVPALQKGTWQWANASGNAVAYTRQSGASEVVVGLAKDGAASFNIGGITNGTYRDAVTGKTIVVSGGSIAFNVASGSAGIYVLNGSGMIGESGAGFFEDYVEDCVDPVVVNISPTSDNYDQPVTVTMEGVGGTGNKTIYFTTDGIEPTTSSTVYTSSFVVSTHTVVRAIAVDGNGRVSDINGQVYNFEKAGARVTIYYTLDGSTPTTASSVHSNASSINGAEGSTVVLNYIAVKLKKMTITG